MKLKLPKLFKRGKKNQTSPKDAIETTSTNETFHKLELEDLVRQLNTSLTDGMTSATAAQVLAKNGKNLIKQKSENPVLKIIKYFLSGFCPLIWVAAIICILAWQPLGSIGGSQPQIINLGLGVLLIIVILLQAAFTAFQDWSSGKVMKSIKNMMPSAASVIRDGKEKKIPTEEVVVGDVIILSYGNKVPADCRIIETKDLKFDKSMLTGESEAIEGTIECTDEKYVESKNIGFMTTLITNGSGRAIVVATGSQTMMGKIAGLTNVTKEKKTRLQKELTRFVAIIGTAASIMALIVIITWVAWLRVQHGTYINLSSFLVNTISVMIAFIPEGLPVCVTLSLLIIAKRMAKSRVLVKNLSVIETLSCVNVIASDKTGTLTQNKMFVASAAVGLNAVDLNEASKPEYERTMAFNQLVSACGLCNNAAFEESDMETLVRNRKAKGDATDIALLKFSAEYETFSHMDQKYTTIAEIPFNSRNKWMVKVIKPRDMQVHKQIFAGPEEDPESDIVLLKGAPDYLLKKSTHILQSNGHMIPIKPHIVNSLVQLQNDWCVLGQRVLIICKKKCNLQEALSMPSTSANASPSSNELESYIHKSNDFCIVGLVGIIDPPREGIADVITKCRQAGIRVFMVTGDYALTAAAIALQIGIFTQPQYDTVESMRIKHKEKTTSYESSSLLLTGNDLDTMTPEDWRAVTPYQEIVLARTTPEQKLRTVKEFQADGYIVGVTGDGVNDAPALKSADIGIAMGSGSEVAMEASQLVLLDNNFSSILIAIENGRLVFENLRKVVLYLLPGGCFAELIPVLMSIFLGVSQNLSSFQMLIISLFTDISPSLSLMMEKPEVDLLKQQPRSKKDHLVDWKFLMHAYLFLGVMIVIGSQTMFFTYMATYSGLSPSDIFMSFEQLPNIFNATAYDRFKDNYNMSDYNTVNDILNTYYFTGQTCVFVALVLLQIFSNLLSTRTHIKSFFQHPPWSKKSRNLWVFAAECVSISIMIFIIYVPVFQNLFQTEPIPVQFFFLPFTFVLFIFCMDELRKLCVRRKILFFHKVAW